MAVSSPGVPVVDGRAAGPTRAGDRQRSGSSGSWSVSERSLKVFAGVAPLAILGLAARAADSHGSMGRGIAQLTDLASTLGLVTVAIVVLAPYAAAARGHRSAPTYREHLRTWGLRLVPVSWLVVVAAYLFPPEKGAAQVTTSFGSAASGTTSVPFGALLRGLTFTQPYGPSPLSGPIAHLWPVAAAVAFVLVAPVLAMVLWPTSTGTRGRDAADGKGTRALVVLTALAAAAVIFRVVARLLAPSHVEVVHWLPANLDAFAAGAAVLVVATHPGARLVRWRTGLGTTKAQHLMLLAAVVVGPIGLWWLGGPRLAVAVGDGTGVAQHVAFVITTTALTGRSLLRTTRRRRVFSAADDALRRRFAGPARRTTVAYASAAYGAYAWSAIALGRWVSQPATGTGAPASARHPGAYGTAALIPTIAWAFGVSAALAAVTWFVVQRPMRRYERHRPSRFAIGLWAITLASFAVRIWSFGTLNARNAGNGDPFYYHAQANMIADGIGFGEPFTWLAQHRFVAAAIHPPLFTLWLTPASLLGARGFLAHKVMAAIGGLAVVVVAGLLARRLAGPRAGLVAAALVALYPDLWIVDGTLWPEGLYTALVGLALLGAYRWLDRPTLGRAALVGAAIGAAILTRGEAILALVFLCAPLAWAGRRRVPRWPLHGGVMAVVALALLAPWTLRNLAAFDRTVAVSTNSDEVLYYANCPDTYRGPLIGYWSFSCQQRARQERLAAGLSADPPGDESERAAGWGHLGRQYALDHRDRWPVVLTARVLRVWDLAHADTTAKALTFEGRPYVWSRRGLWAYRLALIPGVVGVVLLWRRRRVPVWPLVSMVAMVTFTAAAVYGHIRFRTVGDLVLLVGAGITLDAVLIGVRRGPPAAPEDPLIP